ncbi:MAG: hypothetical protein QM445_01115 [Thermotogota bacterium]|nr:hypothetical protein [Thermotogota bacterium]
MFFVLGKSEKRIEILNQVQNDGFFRSAESGSYIRDPDQLHTGMTLKGAFKLLLLIFALFGGRGTVDGQRRLRQRSASSSQATICPAQSELASQNARLATEGDWPEPADKNYQLSFLPPGLVNPNFLTRSSNPILCFPAKRN